MTTVTIDPQIANTFSDVSIKGFVASELRNVAISPEHLRQLNAEAKSTLDASGVTPATIADHELIKPWRDASRQLGFRPSQYKSSPEALARRLLKNGQISTPLPMVDTYCAWSARHLAPLGGYDMDRLPSSEVVLRFGKTGDHFIPLAGKSSELPVTTNVAVYAADKTVMCWGFNYRDSRETCLTNDTKTALFLGEALTTLQAAAVNSALRSLREFLERHGAVVSPLTTVLASDTSVILEPVP